MGSGKAKLKRNVEGEERKGIARESREGDDMKGNGRAEGLKDRERS